MKKRITIILSIIVMVCLFTGCNQQQKEEAKSIAGKHHVKMEIENYGTIQLELDADEAPITVSNFLELVRSGFYDGLTFHRVVTDFVIQGGRNLNQQNPKMIKGEFKANHVQNNISHVRGTISMARSTNYDSASTQFFIVVSDSTFLDGQYAGFGHVTVGMDVVDSIVKNTIVEQDGETVLAENQPKISKIEVVD